MQKIYVTGSFVFVVSLLVSCFPKSLLLNDELTGSSCIPQETIEVNSFGLNIRETTLEEWNYFGNQIVENGEIINQGNKETDENFWQRVGMYWQEGTGLEKNGRDTDWPWSAAFVSWVMREAGAGDNFLYSIRHSDYIVDSIKNRLSGECENRFIGYRLGEYSPEIGDLVCNSRQDNIDYFSRGRYKSHCDIVVEKSDSLIEVIGGNVGDSVTKRVLSLDPEGRLIDDTEEWFVVIDSNLEPD